MSIEISNEGLSVVAFCILLKKWGVFQNCMTLANIWCWFLFGFYCYDKHRDQLKLDEEKVILSYSLWSVMKENQDRDLKKERK